MFKKTKLISLVVAIVLILSQVSVFASADNYVLEIVGTTQLKLTLEELKAMPKEAQINEDYIYNSKTGEKTAKIKGVSLEYILKQKANVKLENGQVLFEALDGYPIDPQTLQDVFNDELKYVLAYEVNGEKIDNDKNIENDEITIYRKVKQAGEFGTVYKMVNKITILDSEPTQQETTLPEETPVATPSAKFTDITEEYKYAETAIYALANKGILDGMGEGLYAPQNQFTREQFCKIIVASLGYETKGYTGTFSDVASERWSAPYIQAAVENGLFVGNPDNTFLPEKVITRQEMAAVAARAAVAAEKVAQEKLNKFVMDKSNFADKEAVAEWAGNSVAWLEAQGVFEGIAKDNFEPLKDVNRAEAAVVVFNTLFK